jgi:hypothetical protein
MLKIELYALSGEVFAVRRPESALLGFARIRTQNRRPLLLDARGHKPPPRQPFSRAAEGAVYGRRNREKQQPGRPFRADG